MKKNLTFLILISCFYSSSAQDLIILKNLDSIQCSIIEFDEALVKYRSDADSAISEIARDQVGFMSFARSHFYTGDVIFRTNGKKIKCTIIDEQEDRYSILTYAEKRDLYTTIRKSEVSHIEYGEYERYESEEHPFMVGGVGVGIDHGGIGVNFSIYPIPQIGVFGGFGYAIHDVGYNFGIKIRPYDPGKSFKVLPFFLGMHGYTAVVKEVDSYSTKYLTFKGFSFGAGVDFRPSKRKKIYYSLAIIVPTNNDEINDYLGESDSSPPIRVSFGIRFF